jgi:hypothetical protein
MFKTHAGRLRDRILEAGIDVKWVGSTQAKP